MVQEELSSSFGRDDGVGSHEVCLLGHEVNDVHDHVIAVSIQEFAGKIDTHDVPRHVRNGHRVKFTVGFMPRRLRATAQIASLCVQANLPAKTGPPVASRNQFEGFEPSGMSCNARVMMLLDDPSPKVFVFWDVDLATKEKDMIFEGPFGTSN